MTRDYKGRPLVCDAKNVDRVARSLRVVLQGEPICDGMAALQTVICDVIFKGAPGLSSARYAEAIDAIAPDMKFYLDALVQLRDVGGRPQ